MDTAGWFADVGIRIFEGYGLTETSPVLALNNAQIIALVSRQAHLIGGVQLRRRRRITGKGTIVFAGYWRKPDATPEAIETDGWFHTGDIARLDADGFLYVTDRKKELLKTSGGKMIAPQPIEGKLNKACWSRAPYWWATGTNF